MPTPLVVTPTYNEAENLPRLIAGLREAVPGVHVLVVDDGSPDGTADLARRESERGDVHLLERTGKQGLASAYVAGFQWALERGYDRVIQMDADLSHDTRDVPRLLAGAQELVLGSRYVPGGGTRNWPLHRRSLSRFGSLYARAVLSLPYRDLTGGFKAWRRPALEHALARPVTSEGYSFQVEMTLRVARAGLSVGEVPIVFTERVAGASKMTLDIALEAAWLVPLLRFR